MSPNLVTTTKQFSKHLWDQQCPRICCRQHPHYYGSSDSLHHSVVTTNSIVHPVIDQSDSYCVIHYDQPATVRRRSSLPPDDSTSQLLGVPYLQDVNVPYLQDTTTSGSSSHRSLFSTSYYYNLHNVLIMRPSFCRSFSTAKQRSSAFPTKTSTYYDDLEVPVTANKAEIRRSFLRLAKRYHPDTATGDDQLGHQQFNKIHLAYDVLSDDVKRREYDWKSRGIWRHSPSGVDPLDHASDFQQQRREFWRHWEERKRNAAREEGEEEWGSSAGPIPPRKFRYTEAELAEMEAAERASRLEYQQRMAERLRDIGKKREAKRTEAYQAARRRYAANIDTEDDDNIEKPQRRSTGFPLQLMCSLRHYLGSLWMRHRFVTTMSVSSWSTVM